MRTRWPEAHTLAGADAMDALNAQDRALFERHATRCPECSAEVGGLREAHRLPGHSGGRLAPSRAARRAAGGNGTNPAGKNSRPIRHYRLFPSPPLGDIDDPAQPGRRFSRPGLSLSGVTRWRCLRAGRRFGVVLFYRGSWCPYCNAQLRAFQRASDRLADSRRQRRRAVGGRRGHHRCTDRQARPHFPGRAQRRRAASPRPPVPSRPGPGVLQSTGFVLDPAGRVVVSVYSSGAIGRLVPEDVIGLIGYLRERDAALRST